MNNLGISRELKLNCGNTFFKYKYGQWSVLARNDRKMFQSKSFLSRLCNTTAQTQVREMPNSTPHPLSRK